MASGTMSRPSNTSELQLYRVLERANLLGYFDTFIQQGGDDVGQLCEAGEEEFLEIMALVGMASKPLHVRRLQRALQDWVQNPEPFQLPITSPPETIGPTVQSFTSLAATTSATATSTSSYTSKWSNNASEDSKPTNLAYISAVTSALTSKTEDTGSQPDLDVYSVGTQYELDDLAIAAIREAAVQLLEAERPISPAVMNKKTTKELQHVFEMADDDPGWMREVRKFSAIYGRFDSKRNPEKLLSQHEVCVNEAAAQLCSIETALLANRERLFPLARTVVRESGYKFKHGHSSSSLRSGTSTRPGPGALAESANSETSEASEPSAKRIKTEPVDSKNAKGLNTKAVQAELVRLKRQERMSEIIKNLRQVREKQENVRSQIEVESNKDDDTVTNVYDLQVELEQLTSQQLALMTEQTELNKKQRRSDRYYDLKTKEKDNNDEEGDANSYLGMDENGMNLDSRSLSPSLSSPSSSSKSSSEEAQNGQSGDKQNNSHQVQNIVMKHMQSTLLVEGLRVIQAATEEDDDHV